MRNYDSTVQDSHKHHFPIVQKECLGEGLKNILNSTQMSVSFFFHKSMYCVTFDYNIELDAISRNYEMHEWRVKTIPKTTK